MLPECAITWRHRKAVWPKGILSHWSPQGSDRVVSVVEISVSDTATALPHRYRLNGRSFTVLLIDKDGDGAFQSTQPIPMKHLESTIDGIPMLKAEQR